MIRSSLSHRILAFLACLCLWPTSVASSSLESELSELKRTLGWQWAASQSFILSRSRLELQPFVADQDLVSSARQLAAVGSPRLNRMSFSSAEIQLSGLWKGKHWLARLWPTPQGMTVGVLSSLSLRVEPTPRFPALRYLPADCQSLLQVHGSILGQRDQLLAYRCAASPATIRQHVQHALHAAGWRPRGPDGKQPGAGQQTERPMIPTPSTDWHHAQWSGLLTLITHAASADAADVVFWLRPEVP